MTSFSLLSMHLPQSWTFIPRNFATIVSSKDSPDVPTLHLLPVGPVLNTNVFETDKAMPISLQYLSTRFSSVFIPLLGVLDIRIKSSAKNIPVNTIPPTSTPSSFPVFYSENHKIGKQHYTETKANLMLLQSK